ncbi:hypothetical protein THRCLA_21186 [Thraustotheca clavata]|uniref:Secreted protein n=1 Tax=Thraustotheca clavata TaxID=74557 RepID=A0A1V9ZZH1_9STRA|nr:hypothetical protein THRCLA_21186 [Thraustotheca clavata]
MYYILLSTVASLGYIVASVATDAMVVQHAQREPWAIRRKLQSASYGVRYASSLAPQILIGVSLNGPKFGGSFNWSLHINDFTASCCFLVDLFFGSLHGQSLEALALTSDISEMRFSILNTVGRWGVYMNWRRTIALATIGIVVIDATIVFCTA